MGICCVTQEAPSRAVWQPRGVGWGRRWEGGSGRREGTYVYWFMLMYSRGLPHSSVSKESASNAGDPGLIPGSGRSPEEGIGYPLHYSRASLVAQLVKNPPATRESWVWFLGREDPLEEHMATHSSFLAWRIPWTEEPGRLQSMGSQRFGHNWATKHTHTTHTKKPITKAQNS